MEKFLLSTILPPISISLGLLAFGLFSLRTKDVSLKGFPRRDERPGGEGALKITSSAFEHLQMIPKKYTCDGENIAPDLEISNVPENAQSLVLIMHDNDAPIEGGWTHWTIFNLDVMTDRIEAGKLPQGAVESETSFGVPGYGGPCPPSGTHHYEFKLYALDSNLTLDQHAKKGDIEHAMEDHIIDKATLIGLYKREH